MYLQTLDNRSHKLLTVLSSAVQHSSDTRIAVAYVSRSGLELLLPAIDTSLRKDAEVEFLVGLDRNVTEPAALYLLHQLSQSQPNLHLYCHASRSQTEIYHPKVYLTRNKGETTAIVGSSNLTAGGLRNNIEVNVAIVGSPHEEAVADIYQAYQELKFHPQRVVPDVGFLNLYREICERETRYQKESRAEKASQELEQRFKSKAQSLQRPIIKKKDLVGWLDLVYDRLPDGEFTTQDSYALEDELRKYYPTNQHIRAKIRQKLQELRGLGFLEHVATGRWRKL